MKISHRLWALSALSAGGLALVAGVSYFAVTSIQSDLEGLTLRAAPLQSKTYEVQERAAQECEERPTEGDAGSATLTQSEVGR